MRMEEGDSGIQTVGPALCALGHSWHETWPHTSLGELCHLFEESQNYLGVSFPLEAKLSFQVLDDSTSACEEMSLDGRTEDRGVSTLGALLQGTWDPGTARLHAT